MATLYTELDEHSPLDARILANRSRIARQIASYASVTAVLLVIAAVVVWALQPAYLQVVLYAALIAPIGAAAVLFPFLERRGHGEAGMALFIAALVVLPSTCPPLIPEVLPSAILCFIMAVALGYLLLGPRLGHLVFAAAALLLLVDIVLVDQVPGLGLGLPPFSPLVSLAVQLLVAGSVFLAAGLILWVIVTGQDNALREAQQATLGLQQSMTVERQQRERLEEASLEIGQRASAEKRQRESLEQLVAQIRDASNSLSAASSEILAATTQQAASAAEQSAATAQTSTTVDEVKAISEQSTRRAEELATAAQRTVEVGRTGQRSVHDILEAMSRIRQQVEGIATNIMTLSEQTQQIGEIIASVNDIASQSNMLALNASVEAARAGEHGKGFAIVAVEVRQLAEQSREATQQVRTILSDIQKATNTTVLATEEGVKSVDEGVKLGALTRDAIEQLSRVITESSQAALQMVAGGRQQASGIEQIAGAMHNINQATQQNLSAVRQAEQAARGLDGLARRLNDIVATSR